MLQEWLDSVYAGEPGAWWRRVVGEERDKFEAQVLGRVRAFVTSPELEDAFEAQFDGTEILPLALEAEFDQSFVEEPLAASELMVPITLRAFHVLEHKNLVRARKDGVRVALTRYDPDEGLLPTAPEGPSL